MAAMLEAFTVVHKGGAVLWQKMFNELKGDPISDLVKTVLLEERTGENVFKKDAYQLKWALANEFDLVFVVVCTSAVSLLLIDELLDRVKATFVKRFKDRITALPPSGFQFDFENEWQKILKTWEADLQAWKNKGQKNFEDTDLAKDIRNPNDKKKEKEPSKPKKGADDAEGGEDEGAGPAEDGDKGLGSKAKPGARQQRAFVKKDKKGAEATTEGSPKKGKQARSWDPLQQGPGQDGPLDRCTDRPEDAPKETAEEAQAYIGNAEKANVDEWEIESDDEEPVKGKDDGKKKSKGIFSYLQGITGSRALEKEDLEPVLAQFKELLVDKNVAMDIAEKLTTSVGTSLEGKKVSGFNGVKNAVKSALEDGLTRILTPKQSIDILRQIKIKQAQQTPYVIVFVGVNGVGKSTSLSKVCFWLKQQKLKVLLAACDTFRSGAVEQLKTHAARLDVPVFEKGYNKDAAGICMESVKYAGQNGFDVVLVDTAGRMQDNQPLMASLSKLVNLNSPDLVLFVGEALVGNDSIDQVTKFNQALKETSYGSGQPRLIDGIMLTKFDTIDDKVGAAVSMVYVTGQPVLLVGVGQTYTDLKKLNAKNIVKLLLR